MDIYHSTSDAQVRTDYDAAKASYARLGVDADKAIERALSQSISIHCWQGDDVKGFEETLESVDGGGILATGSFPGRARTADELRGDVEKVIELCPGKLRFNLHASYLESGGKVVDRDALEPKHFSRWVEWARRLDIGLDFNSTFFAHPKANDGLTLSHPDADIRAFWVRHGIASRHIAEYMGKELGNPCVINHWIPDGIKDSPADRWSPRARLVESLDAMFSKDHRIDTRHCIDAVESKLFGLGSEDYVVGSAEFYNHYALTRKLMYCLDMGHFHPTETIHDKFSALLQFHERILLHVSRPIRWDSDHVVIFNDDLKNVFLELVRGNALERATVALDFFDASINRIMAYVIGIRATRKAMLYALLDPVNALQELELERKGGQKLALMDEMKTMPFGAVWNMLCLKANKAAGAAWIPEVEAYTREVLSTRTEEPIQSLT